ncbi:MAG: 2-phospho-L-lactate guanylyltransferase [Hyphomicrobiales bacterium]
MSREGLEASEAMRAAAIWAIVPVKTLALAKARLAPVLPAPIRRQLVLTMLEDVLELLLGKPAVDRVLVVTADAEVCALARDRGAMALQEDDASGLNPAVRRGVAYARGHGADRMLYLPADVPLATSAEIDQIVTPALHSPSAVIVSARDGDGTNALFFSPAGAFDPSFGAGSFARHCRQAVANGLRLRVLRLSGVGADIDEAADLATLLKSDRGPSRYGFLEPAMRVLALVEHEQSGAKGS